MNTDPFGPGYQLDLWINDWREKKKAALEAAIITQSGNEKTLYFKTVKKVIDEEEEEKLSKSKWWVDSLERLTALVEESPPANEQEIVEILKICVSMPSNLIFQSHSNQNQVLSALKKLASLMWCCCAKK